MVVMIFSHHLTLDCVITEPGTLAYSRGSQPGAFLLQRGHLATSGNILVVTAGAMLLSSSGYRSGILLNIPQYTRQSSTKKDLVPQVMVLRLRDLMFMIPPQPLGYKIPMASGSVLFAVMSTASNPKPATCLIDICWINEKMKGIKYAGLCE